MTRKIDYVHAATLTALEGVDKALKALTPYRSLPPDIHAVVLDNILASTRRLIAVKTDLQYAEELIMDWKRAAGEVDP